MLGSGLVETSADVSRAFFHVLVGEREVDLIRIDVAAAPLLRLDVIQGRSDWP